MADKTDQQLHELFSELSNKVVLTERAILDSRSAVQTMNLCSDLNLTLIEFEGVVREMSRRQAIGERSA